MNSDTRSPAEIERDLEREREELAHSLSILQERFSVEGITRQVADQVSRHGSEIGHSVGRSVKENPIALALTGIGLGWMMFGGQQGNGHAGGHEFGRTGNGSAAGRTGDGRVQTARYGPDDWASATGDPASGSASGMGERWDRMSAATDRYGRRIRASAEDMRRRIGEGTEAMTEEARRRVIEAREAAWRAQAGVEDTARQTWHGARDFYLGQPLVAGALALAVGAALGASLPRTRSEDEAMGGLSDSLFEEAERIYREEKEKVKDVTRAAADEARTVVREKKAEADSKAPAGKSAGEEVADEAKSATRRVARAARDEAERQDLGSDLGKSTH